MSLRWKAGQKAWRFNLSHQTQHPNPTALLRAFLLTHRNYFTYHFKRLLLASIAIHTTTGKEPTAINCCESASDSFKTPFKSSEWNSEEPIVTRKKEKAFQCTKTILLHCVQTLTRMHFSCKDHHLKDHLCLLKAFKRLALLNKSEIIKKKHVGSIACELCAWSNLRFQ